MLKNERENEIINILRMQNGFCTVKALCTSLFTSESSIRRDLADLERKGIIHRVYGGAELITNSSAIVDFHTRSYHNSDEKRIIAKKAAALIKDGSIIFLDQSSSTFYLAKEIMSKNSLTVITNNIEIISLFADTNINVISSGGKLSRENRMCLVGPDAHYIFENTYADMLFFSSKSLSSDGIISDCSRDEIAIRKIMLKNAAQKIFLCDFEKIGTRSAYKQTDLSEIDYLVCERDLSGKFNQFSDTLKIM